MQETTRESSRSVGTWEKLAAEVVSLLGAVFILALCSTAPAGEARGKLVGMYVHQHWPYHHPYAARTWTLEDWRGYADGLHRLGYNAVLIWPVLETMPEPLTASDRANLRKIAQVIDMLHNQFGMRAYIALCPNVIARDAGRREGPLSEKALLLLRRPREPGRPGGDEAPARAESQAAGPVQEHGRRGDY